VNLRKYWEVRLPYFALLTERLRALYRKTRIKMEVVSFTIALRIFDHAGIPACLVGEMALNYYNVPRVLHVSVLELLASANNSSNLRITGYRNMCTRYIRI
jgi:hypothetical protein